MTSLDGHPDFRDMVAMLCDEHAECPARGASSSRRADRGGAG